MKKRSKQILKILCSVLIFALISGLFNFIVTPVTYGHWAIHDRKLLSGKIDTVIIGDSLPLYAVQPQKLDEASGCTSFNACSANQFIDESYYMLLDFIKTEKIKTVYYGLDYYNFLKKAEKGSLMSAQVVFKRLRNPEVKLMYFKNYFKADEGWKWLFPERLSTDRFTEIPNQLKVKLSNEYFRYLPAKSSADLLDSGTYYYDRGYVRTDVCNEPYTEGSFDMKEMSESSLAWFEKILELCKENNIDLKLFHTPVKKDSLSAIENFEFFTDTVNSLANKYGYSFTDYNRYPLRENLSEETGFVNAAHLNYTGSNIFMQWLCEDSK